MVSDFSDYCCSNLENKKTWPLKGESTLQKQLLKGVLQTCIWQLLLKLFKNVSGFELGKKSSFAKISGFCEVSI